MAILGMWLLLMMISEETDAYGPVPMIPPASSIQQPQPNLVANPNPMAQVYQIKNVVPAIYPNVQQGYPNLPSYQQPIQGNLYAAPAPVAVPVTPSAIRCPPRASNKFHNHGEGPFKGLLQVKSAY